MDNDFLQWPQAPAVVLPAFDKLRAHWQSADVRVLAPSRVSSRTVEVHWVRMVASFDPVTVSTLHERFKSPTLLQGRLSVDDARRFIEAWLSERRVTIDGLELVPPSAASHVTVIDGADLAGAHNWWLEVAGTPRRFRGLTFSGLASSSDNTLAHSLDRELGQKSTRWGFRDLADVLATEMGSPNRQVPSTPSFEFMGAVPLAIDGAFKAPETVDVSIVWRATVPIAEYEVAGPAATWSLREVCRRVPEGEPARDGWLVASEDVAVDAAADSAGVWLVHDDEPYVHATIDLVPHTRERQMVLGLDGLYPSDQLGDALLPISLGGRASEHFEQAVRNLFSAAGFSTLDSGHNSKSRGIDCLTFDTASGICCCVSATLGAGLQGKLDTLLVEMGTWRERLSLWALHGLIVTPVDPSDLAQAGLDACTGAKVAVLTRTQLSALVGAPHRLRDILNDMLRALALPGDAAKWRLRPFYGDRW